MLIQRHITKLSVTRRLLLVWHSRTGLAKQMASAMADGASAAGRDMGEPLNVSSLCAADAGIDDVLNADGYLFCCPENLASTSGEMLEFFHRTYYHAFANGETSILQSRPFGLAIAAGSDGTNAARQVERICRGWQLKAVADTYINTNGLLVQTKEAILKPKLIDAEAEARCAELGGLVAATVLL